MDQCECLSLSSPSGFKARPTPLYLRFHSLSLFLISLRLIQAKKHPWKLTALLWHHNDKLFGFDFGSKHNHNQEDKVLGCSSLVSVTITWAANFAKTVRQLQLIALTRNVE